MSDPLPAPAFGLQYNTPLTDIGSGYAAGITSAGNSIAGAIGSVSDMLKQNVDTNDTLTAMKEGGILKKEEYDTVMGKSLGAKQQMLGLYAGNYIADQAERRAAALQTGKAAADIATEHAKLLDMISAVKSGYGTAAGVNTGKLPITPQPVQPVQPAQPVKRAQPAPLGGTPQNPTPLGSGNIYNPVAAAAPASASKIAVGNAFGKGEQIPVGSKRGTLGGQDGYLMPDGVTFRPLQ